MNNIKVTGQMVNYYFVCQRKLWLYQHHISYEKSNQNVQTGQIVDEQSYDGKSMHHVALDNQINIDMIQDWNIVHEVKKSDAIEPAAIWQLKYYIYYLRKKGISISQGIVDYTTLRKCVKVDYTNDDEKQMEKYIKEIQQICALPKPPKPKFKSICKSCAFYEYCFS